MNNKPDTPHSNAQRFVEFICAFIKKEDNAAIAAFKRADNPNLEYQSWDYLMRLPFVDIENKYQLLPYTTIASAMAKAKIEQNGTVKIGLAIAQCYDDGNNSEQAKAKLRRLLACDKIDEVCRVLRPLFSLINAKAGIQLDYASLLKDLLFFNVNPQKIKTRWAQSFYHHTVQNDDSEDNT